MSRCRKIFKLIFFFTYVLQLIRIVFNVQCHVSQNKANCFTLPSASNLLCVINVFIWKFYHCQVTWLMDKNNFVSPCRKFFVLCLGLGGKIWCVSLYSRSTRSHHIFSAIFLIICEFNNFILVYINLQPSEYFRYWINRLYIVNCSDSLYIIHKIKRLDYI